MLGGPPCSWGIPCIHQFDTEEYEPYCFYPHYSGEKRDNRKQRESKFFYTTYEMSLKECPLFDDLEFGDHIQRMFDGMCDWCQGEGFVYALKNKKKLEGLDFDKDFDKKDCSKCKGTGKRIE